MNKMRTLTVVGAISIFSLGSILFFATQVTTEKNNQKYVYQIDQHSAKYIEEARKTKSSLPLWEKYKDLKVIDVHNHDAPNVENTLPIWDKYHIDKVVLFGAASEPAAIRDDQKSWEAFNRYPDRFYPYFSGFDMHSEDGIKTVRDNLEQGYMGVGEVIAASTYSPVTSKVKWKGKDATDGHLLEIYQICAQYQVPILLHIDPLDGIQFNALSDALQKSPQTKIILAHANVSFNKNNSAILASMLETYPNLYIDFFAGFTVDDPGSNLKLDDYIPIMERFPDRFFLSTDSAYGLASYEQAYDAIYQVIDKLTPETAAKVAYQNFERIMEEQMPTQTQLKKLTELANDAGEKIEPSLFNKRQAAQKIQELQKALLKK